MALMGGISISQHNRASNTFAHNLANQGASLRGDFVEWSVAFLLFVYVFNLFSHNAPIVSNGYNEEEMKLVKETRKIWNDKDVRVSATCIRVPVMRANVESVNLQFENPLDEVKHGLGTFKSSLKGGVHIVKADQEDTTWKNPEPNHYHAKRSFSAAVQFASPSNRKLLSNLATVQFLLSNCEVPSPPSPSSIQPPSNHSVVQLDPVSATVLQIQFAPPSVKSSLTRTY
ncbi:hypothetical protein QYF36_019683 [Acer negundo]|nr:hypothetical protein QYF36_019683 [Acer negundo]